MSFRPLKVMMVAAVLCTCVLAAGLSARAASQELPGMSGTDLEKIVGENKGKVILVNVFASWCPPCDKEMPTLNKLRKTFTEKELYMAGVSVDEDRAELRVFLDKHKLAFPAFEAKGNFYEAVGVSSIPQLILFNKSGELVTNHKGYVDEDTLFKAVQELVAE